MGDSIILDVECIICNKSLQKICHNPHGLLRKMGKICNSRRSRTPNWSPDEKQYLLQLIKERKDATVPKNNNGPNYSEEKDVAWNEILHLLASRFGNKFQGSSIKKVKTQWQNMRRIARDEITQNGANIHTLSKQSYEVCSLLDMIQDGVLKRDSENINNNENVDPNDSTITANVEIKTECIDDDMNQPSCSGENNTIDNSSSQTSQMTTSNNNTMRLSSSSTISEDNSEVFENEGIDKNSQTEEINKKDTDAVNPINAELLARRNLFKKEFQEFFRFTAAEKQIKLESLKEERQIVRAMRETAELNKIIAEQKLKHIIWIKKQEMMYSGEPGSGAGRGGGGGGSIREAGGSFGKMEAAREDQYYYKKQKEQLANMKDHLNKEIAFHQDQIKRHEDAIKRHKEQMLEKPQ